MAVGPCQLILNQFVLFKQPGQLVKRCFLSRVLPLPIAFASAMMMEQHLFLNVFKTGDGSCIRNGILSATAVFGGITSIAIGCLYKLVFCHQGFEKHRHSL